MQVICDKKECSFCSDNGFCTKEFVVIRPFAVCSEWYNKNGQPFIEQLSVALEREFKEYDNNRNNSSDTVDSSTNDSGSSTTDDISTDTDNSEQNKTYKDTGVTNETD